MRVLVCGGRNFGNTEDIPSNLPGDDYERLRVEREFQFVWDYLTQHLLSQFIDDSNMIIFGGAQGVDTIARNWAIQNEFITYEFLADWKKHGRAAGPMRNQQMLDEGKPDLVVAFPGGRGTADMVRRAKKAEVKVVEVVYDKG